MHCRFAPSWLRPVQIRILFFGLLKDICGRAEDLLELPSGSTLRSVFDHYAEQFPTLSTMARSIVLARNQEFATPSDMLAEGDEVALLPPVSGGSSLREIIDPAGHFFALTRDPIDPRAAEYRLLQGFDGAIVTFQGVVRNNTRGRATLRLEYECYEAMAIRKMAEIGREIAGQFAISRIAMMHRLGMMEIGEASVVVIAAAPHRSPAFDAALEGINRLKRLVPDLEKGILRGWRGLGRRGVGPECASRCCSLARIAGHSRPLLAQEDATIRVDVRLVRILATVKDRVRRACRIARQSRFRGDATTARRSRSPSSSARPNSRSRSRC